MPRYCCQKFRFIAFVALCSHALTVGRRLTAGNDLHRGSGGRGTTNSPPEQGVWATRVHWSRGRPYARPHRLAYDLAISRSVCSQAPTASTVTSLSLASELVIVFHGEDFTFHVAAGFGPFVVVPVGQDSAGKPDDGFPDVRRPGAEAGHHLIGPGGQRRSARRAASAPTAGSTSRATAPGGLSRPCRPGWSISAAGSRGRRSPVRADLPIGRAAHSCSAAASVTAGRTPSSPAANPRRPPARLGSWRRASRIARQDRPGSWP